MSGLLIAFEGLDQSGKETQAKVLQARLEGDGFRCRLLFFPDYDTPIGQEIGRGLRGERDVAPDVMQLLFIANRYEYRSRLERWLANGVIVLCDRYVASSVAYGEGHGLDPAWLTDTQRFLPPAGLTLFLDIRPETAAGRKAVGRDRYERDLALLSRVRASYERQAVEPGWIRIDGERAREAVAAEIATAVAARLARR